MRRALLAAGLLLLAVRDVPAQIYARQDAGGAWVLSDHELGPGARTFAVPEARAYRATRPVPASAAAGYESLIRTHAERTGLSPDLVRAVIQVESAFNPAARSPKGAMGLMQLMPQTAAWLGVNRPYDPDQNIAGGTTYLRALLDRYGGDVTLALAAYNAGPAAVERFGFRVPPFAETTAYVRRVDRAAGTPATAGRAQVSSAAPGPAATTRAAQAHARPTPAATPVIYRVVDIVEGRPVARYTTERPASGSYEVVQR